MFKKLRMAVKLSRGGKSTEFMVTVLAGVILFFNDHFGFGLDEATVYSIAGVAISYVLGRSGVKARESAGGGQQS